VTVVTPNANGQLDYLGVVQLVQPYAGEFANDPTFLQIVAAGASAESGWNVNSQQVPGVNGGGKGLFQFDFSGGQGSSAIQNGIWSSWTDALGANGAQTQARLIVPQYASAYARGMQMGLTGQNLATYTIGAAENPRGHTPGAIQWNDTSYLNYVQAWNFVTGNHGNVPIPNSGGITLPTTTGGVTVQMPGTSGVGVGTTSVGSSGGLTGPTGGSTDTNPGGSAIVTGSGSTTTTAVPQLSGTAGAIQAGLLGFFGSFMSKFGSGFVLLIASVFAILIGAIIWRGEDVKKVGGDVAVGAIAG